MAVPQSIESILGDKLKEVLTRWCITGVPLDDESRANHVILGKPTTELRDAVVISIHTEHPLGPISDKDHIVMGTPRSDDERPFKWPAETTGGMRSKVVIGAIQVNIREMFAYEIAKAINGAVASRIEAAINQDAELDAFNDDFGNFMSRIETFQGSGYQAGGGNVSINIRWIDWRAFVHATNCRGQQ